MSGYNLAIPDTILNSVSRCARSEHGPHAAWRIILLLPVLVLSASAADWSAPEQELATKIAAAIGKGPASLSVENRSSLARRDVEIIQNGLRSVLQDMGVSFVSAVNPPFTVTVSLSENSTSYVWVAEIRRGSDVPRIAIVSTDRPASVNAAHDPVPLTLKSMPLWSQSTPILDVVVLEEGVGPVRIAVLDAEQVALYRMHDGKWIPEQRLTVQHDRPWPRDLRGRLFPSADHGLDAYLPGVVCHAVVNATAALSCRNSNDPWPLGGSDSPYGSLRAYFSPTRNFFTGVLNAPPRTSAITPFYAAAMLPRGNSTDLIFSGVDGQVHILGDAERVMKVRWGSDIASVRTACGAGWQLLATSSDEGVSDTIRAFEFPERDPVAVSAAIDFPGAISAFWTETKGDTAVAVSKNENTGDYEAFRLSVACSR